MITFNLNTDVQTVNLLILFQLVHHYTHMLLAHVQSKSFSSQSLKISKYITIIKQLVSWILTNHSFKRNNLSTKPWNKLSW